jgi:hypothetical protein
MDVREELRASKLRQHSEAISIRSMGISADGDSVTNSDHVDNTSHYMTVKRFIWVYVAKLACCSTRTLSESRSYPNDHAVLAVLHWWLSSMCADIEVEQAFKVSTDRPGSFDQPAFMTTVREVPMRLTDWVDNQRAFI